MLYFNYELLMKKHTMSTFYQPHFFEHDAWKQNTYVCGIDEVGRGALAGPVVVAAVILPLNYPIEFKDSKKLSSSGREKAYELIMRDAFVVLMQADNHTIDYFNIYQTTKLLMQRACITALAFYQEKNQRIKYILTDAMPLSVRYKPADYSPEYKHAPFGESWSTSIAAASIVAKVTRDRLMKDYEDLFPVFNFSEHKAYGTKKHCASLEKYGMSFLHRNSFIVKSLHKELLTQNILSQDNQKATQEQRVKRVKNETLKEPQINNKEKSESSYEHKQRLLF